ncbi:hypothetical protein SEEGA711_26035, partial [Salmonella enterica subsp. enterica serovar Gaminara str. ATCC BAA-711]
MRGIWGISPVYPRWRGEHIKVGDDIVTWCGLSPLARGTRWNRAKLCLFPRFIPAGAGNTGTDNSTNKKNAVYPRWRGEHSTKPKCENPVYGLSPLARGTRFWLSERRPPPRFIPAGAGNTEA